MRYKIGNDEIDLVFDTWVEEVQNEIQIGSIRYRVFSLHKMRHPLDKDLYFTLMFELQPVESRGVQDNELIELPLYLELAGKSYVK